MNNDEKIKDDEIDVIKNRLKNAFLDYCKARKDIKNESRVKQRELDKNMPTEVKRMAKDKDKKDEDAKLKARERYKLNMENEEYREKVKQQRKLYRERKKQKELEGGKIESKEKEEVVEDVKEEVKDEPDIEPEIKEYKPSPLFRNNKFASNFMRF